MVGLHTHLCPPPLLKVWGERVPAPFLLLRRIYALPCIQYTTVKAILRSSCFKLGQPLWSLVHPNFDLLPDFADYANIFCNASLSIQRPRKQQTTWPGPITSLSLKSPSSQRCLLLKVHVSLGDENNMAISPRPCMSLASLSSALMCSSL